MSTAHAPSLRPTAAHLRLIKQLTEAVAVSGDEGPVRRIVRREVESHADELVIDSIGNLLVTKRGSGRRRLKVMLAAHMDEIGFMITEIQKDGFLRFETVGGIDARQIPGKAVWVGSDRVPGVIGAKPIHLVKKGETKKPIELESMRIDIGADSKEAVPKTIQPGARATFATPYKRLGPTIMAKGLDDRLGVASLIELVRTPPPGIDLYAAFTVQEEVGLRGAHVAAYRLNPDVAIALDCTPARDLPTWEGNENTEYNSRLGEGPAIYVADRGTIADPRLLRLLVETAEREGIPFQFRQPGGGATDAAVIHQSRGGIPSISVSVPGRHMHSAAGIASLADWRNSIRLVYAALSNLKPSFLRMD